MKIFDCFKGKKKTRKTGNYIIDHYTNYDEDARLLKRSRQPEFITTMKYIEKYLNTDSRIIEIGAGTGRYSLALAEKGYDVTAVDLTPHNIEIMRKKVKKHHNIKILEGNACDMSAFSDESFDIVLLLGPMYHLFADDDKKKAMREAIRIAKKGAVIFTSYCNSDTAVYKLFYTGKILDFVDKGLISEDYKGLSKPELVFELYRKPDIDKFMKQFNVTRLHFVGVDMLSYLYDDSLDKLSDREFSEYMKFINSLCEREDVTGLSIHMLDIFRKE